jgi:hypothetical protein
MFPKVLNIFTTITTANIINLERVDFQLGLLGLLYSFLKEKEK